MRTNYKTLKLACYTTNVSMSIVSNLSPLLFLTFRELYGISYSLLGMLVLINFCTQLIIDLIFSFFSKEYFSRRVKIKINHNYLLSNRLINLTVKGMKVPPTALPIVTIKTNNTASSVQTLAKAR